jgi:L-asparaginase II
MTVSNPVLANVWRGSAIESRHRGVVVAIYVTGKQMLALRNQAGTVVGRIEPA